MPWCTVSMGFGIFWGTRLLVQLFGYSSNLWRGKRFETFAHIALTLMWTYFSVVFLWIALR